MAAAAGILFTMNLTLPTLAERAFHLGGGGYGALLAAFGVGGLPGALLAAGSPEPTGRRVAVLALATGASVVLMGLWSMALPGSVPITGFAVAAVIEHVGARAGFAVSGVCLALTALLGWRALGDTEPGSPSAELPQVAAMPQGREELREQPPMADGPAR